MWHRMKLTCECMSDKVIYFKSDKGVSVKSMRQPLAKGGIFHDLESKCKIVQISRMLQML